MSVKPTWWLLVIEVDGKRYTANIPASTEEAARASMAEMLKEFHDKKVIVVEFVKELDK
jgi:hypothetical protein